MTEDEHILCIEIKRRCKDESLSEIQKDYPVSKGTLARVRDGHIVVNPELKLALRLPLYISVIPCSVCGGVHTKECQSPFERRIPENEPMRAEILSFYEFLTREVTL